MDLPPFHPHPLFRGGHGQTIAGGIWPLRLQPRHSRAHRVELPDGDAVMLHEDEPQGEERPQIVLLVHGLGGSRNSGYVRRTAAKLNARGVRTFRIDLRGHGSSATTARHPGHAGRSEDIAAALDWITHRRPQRPRLLVGFSLGANIVLKTAAEYAAEPFAPARVFAVAPPLDLALCAENLTFGSATWYDRIFVRSALARVKPLTRAGVIAGPLLTPPPRRLLDFDERFTAPRSGFSGAAEYYTKSASGPLLPQIAAPTIILAAADDPIIPVRMFANLQAPSHVRVLTTPAGGHVGYIGRRGVDADRCWLDWRIVDWVLADSTPG